MALLNGASPFRFMNEQCSQWAWTYLHISLCSTKDAVAFTLGSVSVASWTVAEIPQLITNYKEKSTEGLSIAFLMTWIVGDIFNLTGCLLEPATLPTQLYMALLYTFITAVLTAQTVYYNHIYHRLKSQRSSMFYKSDKHLEEAVANPVLYKINEDKSWHNEANGSIIVGGQSSPIPVFSPALKRYNSTGRELYYMSARSLTRSPVPTAGLSHSRELSRTPPIHSYLQQPSKEPLLDSNCPPPSTQSSPPRNMLCVASLATFLLCTHRLYLSMYNSIDESSHGTVIVVGRKLLQSQVAESLGGDGGVGSEIATILGWAMSAIYMGGRLPQIWLNIKRGNVEGLSPLMFMFALVGNATYVGSILVNSLDWSLIKPNMPWLVDAGGCVLLDAFILIQFAYYHYWKGDYEEDKYED